MGFYCNPQKLIQKPQHTNVSFICFWLLFVLQFCNKPSERQSISKQKFGWPRARFQDKLDKSNLQAPPSQGRPATEGCEHSCPLSPKLSALRRPLNRSAASPLKTKSLSFVMLAPDTLCLCVFLFGSLQAVKTSLFFGCLSSNSPACLNNLVLSCSGFCFVHWIPAVCAKAARNGVIPVVPKGDMLGAAATPCRRTRFKMANGRRLANI